MLRSGSAPPFYFLLYPFLHMIRHLTKSPDFHHMTTLLFKLVIVHKTIVRLVRGRLLFYLPLFSLLICLGSHCSLKAHCLPPFERLVR